MTGLLFDPEFRAHNPGWGHPECPERYDALKKAFEGAGFFSGGLRLLKPRAASDDDLHRVHTAAYLKTVMHDVARKADMLSTGDTNIGPGSEAIARMAAGGALAGLDAIFGGSVKNAFVAARPPGHHATAARGMGFCFYNNVAVAARYAQKAYGVDRVMIVDWDVHHGNGTQDIFYQDPSVFFFSTHQWPWYPGTGAADETGEGAGKGTTLNCPFPAGAGHAEIVGAFRKKLLPAAAAFKPGLVIVSAGFDSRRGDPLGRFQLKDDDFGELTSVMLEVAELHAGGRLLSVLEGGYSLEGLGKAAVAHVRALRS